MTLQKRKTETSLKTSQPTRELDTVDRRFEDYFGRPFLPAAWQGLNAEEMVWSPALEVAEKDDRFVVKVELPGVKEEDVDVSVSGDMLTISGEKLSESEVKKKGYYYSESSYGSFSRSVILPSSVDVDKIEASYDKGVLEITMPKTPEIKAKKIKVNGQKKEVLSGKKEEPQAKK